MTWTWLFAWNACWLICALLYVPLEDSEERSRLRSVGTESESAYSGGGRRRAAPRFRCGLRHGLGHQQRRDEHQRGPWRPGGESG
jgi:hypothetical protein